MQTKLSKFCGGIIEASWLGALIIIPLFLMFIQAGFLSRIKLPYQEYLFSWV